MPSSTSMPSVGARTEKGDRNFARPKNQRIRWSEDQVIQVLSTSLFSLLSPFLSWMGRLAVWWRSPSDHSISTATCFSMIAGHLISWLTFHVRAERVSIHLLFVIYFLLVKRVNGEVTCLTFHPRFSCVTLWNIINRFLILFLNFSNHFTCRCERGKKLFRSRHRWPAILNIRLEHQWNIRSNHLLSLTQR